MQLISWFLFNLGHHSTISNLYNFKFSGLTLIGGCERIMATRSSKSLPLKFNKLLWASREDASIGGEILSCGKNFNSNINFLTQKNYTDVKCSCEVIGSICHQDVSWMIRLEAEESPWPTGRWEGEFTKWKGEVTSSSCCTNIVRERWQGPL